MFFIVLRGTPVPFFDKAMSCQVWRVDYWEHISACHCHLKPKQNAGAICFIIQSLGLKSGCGWKWRIDLRRKSKVEEWSDSNGFWGPIILGPVQQMAFFKIQRMPSQRHSWGGQTLDVQIPSDASLNRLKRLVQASWELVGWGVWRARSDYIWLVDSSISHDAGWSHQLGSLPQETGGFFNLEHLKFVHTHKPS